MQEIGFVLLPEFQVMALTMVSVFEIANTTIGKATYGIHMLSETGGPIMASAGFAIETTPFGKRRFDKIIIATPTEIIEPSPYLGDFIRYSVKVSRDVAAACTGAFVLAETGILNGCKATTHWAYARLLQERFPKVKVEADRIFVGDGPVWTSAGFTAGIDLALAIVENDYGTDITRALSRKLVVYHRRAGGQSQFSTLLELEPKSDRVRSALEYARANLKNELSVDELAEAANLSSRQFSRIFTAETSLSPAKAVERLRVEAARLMMEEGRHSMDIVARETGFTDRERMRRAFLRTLGQPSHIIRRNVRAMVA